MRLGNIHRIVKNPETGKHKIQIINTLHISKSIFKTLIMRNIHILTELLSIIIFLHLNNKCDQHSGRYLCRELPL